MESVLVSGINHWLAFQAELRERLPRQGAALDLGCGDNSVMAPYRSADLDIWGVDFHAHQRLRDARWFRPLGAHSEIPFPAGTFRLIASISVMEHVADPVSFLGEARRVLAPGGIFIGHSINASHYVAAASRIAGLLPHRLKQGIVRRLYGRNEEDTFPTCYRLNTETAVRAASSLAGFRMISLRRYMDQGYFSFAPGLMPAAAALDAALERLRPGLGSLYFTVVLQRPD